MFDGSQVIGFFHKWSDTERDGAFVKMRESTGHLEVLGAKLWFQAFGSHCRAKRLLLFMDNGAAVQGLQAAYSKTASMNPLIAAARRISAEYHITLRTRFARGELNEIADHLSHLRIAEARCLVRRVFGMDLTVRQI